MNKLARRLRGLLKNGMRSWGYDIVRFHPQRPPPMLGDPLRRAWAERLGGAHTVRTVFDVGANRGQSIPWMRRVFPQALIHSFEPCATPFQVLAERWRHDANVCPVQLALAERAGEAELFENSDDTCNSLLPNSPLIETHAPMHMVQARGSTRVRLERLDAYCQQAGIGCVDVLKIDAQGYERHILNGAGEMLRPERIRSLVLELLFVEYYRGQVWGDELLSLLRQRGYRLFGASLVDFDAQRGWRWMDAHFVPAETAGND